MDTPVVKTILTEADLLRLGTQGLRFEVVEGEIKEMNPVGVEHSDVSGNAYRTLYNFVSQHKLGTVRMDSLIFVLHVDSETGVRTTRIPDTSFVRKGRLPKDFDRSRPFPGAPDLAVEVVSPDETADDLLAKIRDYFTYGTEQVWVLYSEQKELHQHIRGDSTIHVYSQNDTLNGGSLLPGFEVAIREFFVLPED